MLVPAKTAAQDEEGFVMKEYRLRRDEWITLAESDPVNFVKAIYQLDNNHIVSDGKTIDNYYVTSIYINDYNEDMKYDHYRLVLVKDNNSWKVVAAPQPLLTTKNTPNVSTDILKAANNL